MNPAVANASNAFLVRSACLVGIAQIAHVDLTPTLVRQNACYARRVLGAVLSGLTMSPPAETVQSEDTRRRLAFQRSRGAMLARRASTRARLGIMALISARSVL